MTLSAQADSPACLVDFTWHVHMWQCLAFTIGHVHSLTCRLKWAYRITGRKNDKLSPRVNRRTIFHVSVMPNSKINTVSIPWFHSPGRELATWRLLGNCLHFHHSRNRETHQASSDLVRLGFASLTNLSSLKLLLTVTSLNLLLVLSDLFSVLGTSSSNSSSNARSITSVSKPQSGESIVQIETMIL